MFFKKIWSILWGDEKIETVSLLFVALTVLSTAALLISNVIANKLFPLGIQIGGFGLNMTCAIILFPVTYILSDVFSEVYGYSASRRVSWFAFGANVIMVLFFCFADLIPSVAYQRELGYDYAFHVILGIDFSCGLGVLGTLIASLIAFVVGSWVDDIVFEKLKKRVNSDNTMKFIYRAVLSSFCGEIVDSVIFIPFMLLFAGLIGTAINSFWQVFFMVLIQSSIKTLYELLISPLTAIIAKEIKKYENK